MTIADLLTILITPSCWVRNHPTDKTVESIYDLGKDGAHDCVLSFRKGWLKNGATYRVLKISYKDWEAIPVKFDNSGLL